MKQIIHFKGLYGDNQSEFNTNFIDIEPLQKRSEIYNWEIKEHLHTNLIQVFLIVEGEGILFSDTKKIALNPPSMAFIPANSLHGFAFQSNIKGEVITISEAYFNTIFKDLPQFFIHFEQLLHFSLEKNQMDDLLTLKQNIEAEIQTDLIEKTIVLGAYFQLFFTKILRFFEEKNEHLSFNSNRTLTYFQRFQKEIKKSIHENKTIAQFAKELGISAVHLNRICQGVIAKSAHEMVQEYMIEEAKKYLKNEDYSIAEVSYFLDFKDPAYFSRIFKQLTGLSPSEFRMKANN
jgi:AraC family transcriptional regulator, transcriptional activator of pobA